MSKISKQSMITLKITTAVWACIMMCVCVLMYFDITISKFFSYYILIEFAKAIALWYIIAIGSACVIDLTIKKRR